MLRKKHSTTIGMPKIIHVKHLVNTSTNEYSQMTTVWKAFRYGTLLLYTVWVWSRSLAFASLLCSTARRTIQQLRSLIWFFRKRSERSGTSYIVRWKTSLENALWHQFERNFVHTKSFFCFRFAILKYCKLEKTCRLCLELFYQQAS